MKIELEELFKKNVNKGINLFLGAGFSIHSKNSEGENLPLGSELCKELIREFKCPPLNDLAKICTIIDSTESTKLHDYLARRFTVAQYHTKYNSILKINTPRIFTTNIDNLVHKIFENSNNKYLNNIFLNGICFNDSLCVDYIPIHGSIEMPDIKFLFNKQEVSGSFRTRNQAWFSLTQAANQIPSVFIGYSLEDVGAIESLFGKSEISAEQKEKWVLLHKEDPGTEAYFKALGFNLIIGDILDFLEYIDKIEDIKSPSGKNNKDYIEEIYPEAIVPKGPYKGRIRQIDEFFLGSAPIWSDILSNRIHRTSHLGEILNLIEKRKSLIVTGIPASGKSTLMLQLAKELSKNKRVLLFENLSINKSNIIKNEIKHSTTILIDNFTSNIDSFTNLTGNTLIQVIGFDRYYNVDISIHKLPDEFFDFYDVSDLSQRDIQSIYNSIPLSIRKPSLIDKKREDETPSIFEIVNYNITKPELSVRYKSILQDLNKSDSLLLDLLIMTCYLHACRTPVSFEVANSFIGEEVQSYGEVIEMMESLRGMVQETLGYLVDEYDNDQDYYQPRSQILSETIISQTNGKIFRRVYERFHDNVPQHQIPMFYIFKRTAFDAFYVTKAFVNWREGLEFYDRAFATERNPFLLQQCALYLLKKRRYTEAALKIDYALQISKKRYFSIDNTHAIILFKANINSETNDQQIRNTLDKSMKILQECYKEDQRKTYHAVTFAEQALEYYTRFPDEKSNEYLALAYKWLSEINIERKYFHKSSHLLSDIEKLI